MKMCLATGDLRRFVVAQIVSEQAALRLDNKVETLFAVDLNED